MERPIFIVGCPRSGTTLLRVVLDSHPNISCGPESHFLVDLARLEGRHWDRIERLGMTQSRWHEAVATLFADVHREYAENRGKSRWADKTPSYTEILPYIHELFPRAQVVHIIRDGRDVVASHLNRWGRRAAIRATQQWPAYVNTALRYGAQAGPGRYYELRYEGLVTEPEETLRGLFDFLEEPWYDGVLRYDRTDHDVQNLERFTEERRNQSGDNDLIYRSRVGAGARELDPLLSAIFYVRAGRLSQALGYRS